MDSVTRPPAAVNETVRMYAPGSPERASLEKRLVAMAGERIDLGCYQRGPNGAKLWMDLRCGRWCDSSLDTAVEQVDRLLEGGARVGFADDLAAAPAERFTEGGIPCQP